MSAYYVPFGADLEEICDGDIYLKDQHEDVAWNESHPDDYFAPIRATIVWRTDGTLWMDANFGYEYRGPGR